ncbi:MULTISPECIES: hypothetical protein [unclassified Bartonella]|uniref:hypothetical protein n=1 Tax=unclassified Bartonella TaxID=2645622 RepID=UPI00099AD33E|nr:MULTISPECIES: hypothetical protein [unclassified Bartonella]AQX27470.1 hypothetical protein BJB15x_000490 [Bartonella sp. JB15]AQX28750.1 hypothetical protein BJB63x_000470 [Bartonella sp. JB63]
MKKLLSQGLTFVSILICNDAFAGFGENKWIFKPHEKVVIKKLDIAQQGVEYDCKSINPITTFRLTYTDPRGLEYLKIISDNPSQITHSKDSKLFIISNVSSLHVKFPWIGGPYTFENITDNKVVGTNCDSGVYDVGVYGEE